MNIALYILSTILPVALMSDSIYSVYLSNLDRFELDMIEGQEAEQERLYRDYCEGHSDIVYDETTNTYRKVERK